MIFSFLCGRHTGHKREFGSVSENEALSSFPGTIREKIGEEFFIVDTTGHFPSDKETCHSGVAEGYLEYSGYARINGIVRHIYLFTPALTE